MIGEKKEEKANLQIGNKKVGKPAHCPVKKYTRVLFDTNPPSRKSLLLELIYSDFCDTKQVQSLCGVS